MQDRQRGEQSSESSSLYGFGLSHYVQEHHTHHRSAKQTARFVMTHGFRYPEAEAIESLGMFDRAAYDVLDEHDTPIVASLPEGSAAESVWMAVNALGRLHIRSLGAPRPTYGEADDDRWVEIGFAHLGAPAMAEIAARVAGAEARERVAFALVKAALDAVHERGALAAVVDEVNDHVEHVESVCFYLGDRFFGLIDRFVNLIDSKAGKGFLPPLRTKPYAMWTDDEVLMVAALHALFLSGRAVRFEEFNGVTLSADALLRKLDGLLAAYDRADGRDPAPPLTQLFEHARSVRERTLMAVGKPWLRYRWIYGLTFQKKERVLRPTAPRSERPAHIAEFGEDYRRLVAQPDDQAPEHVFFTQLACSYLAQDLVGKPFQVPGSAACGWLAYLMEQIVGSAVLASRSDYGMSSSLRDLHALVDYDEAALVAKIHKLTPAHFFTCFVSNDFGSRIDQETATMIASSVQRRMMFNRWHFIPGNFDREIIAPARHWYYPPLIPDIAIHSDMHRGGHTRAMVKYSVRTPGPDMGRPALQIGNQRYRGFYDVRVVRMEGEPFSTDDLLQVRRRTLWLESVYAVLVAHLQGVAAEPFPIRGFQVGSYRDLTELSRAPYVVRSEPRTKAGPLVTEPSI